MKSKYFEKHDHYHLGRMAHHPDVAAYFRQHYSAAETVLELGAGTGIGTAVLAAYFDNVIAVEPVTNMIDVCKSANNNNINVQFINAAVETLEVDELDYRYLISFQATHWFYETPSYQALCKKAEKPVIDICSFISFPMDQEFFDELAEEYKIVRANRGTKYPFEVTETYAYQKLISTDVAAHQLCSRSWIEHINFPQIRERIAQRYDSENVLVNIETRIHKIAQVNL